MYMLGCDDMVDRKPFVVALLRQVAVFAPVIGAAANKLTGMAVHSCLSRRLLSKRDSLKAGRRTSQLRGGIRRTAPSARRMMGKAACELPLLFAVRLRFPLAVIVIWGRLQASPSNASAQRVSDDRDSRCAGCFD